MDILERMGVLTFHRCINYGTYWQARSLLEGLAGQRPKLLDYRADGATAKELECALNPTLPVPSSEIDTILYRAKVRNFDHAVQCLPRSAPFNLGDPIDAPAFDTVIVGSDEIWNFSHPWFGGERLFFGEGLKARRLISYAASIGNYSLDGAMDARWADDLQRFDAISVRDRNSQHLVEEATGRRPALVLDPCLQFPQPVPAGEWLGPDRDFILVYGHSFPPELTKEISQAASMLGIDLLSIGYRNPWVLQHWISAGPGDFIRAFSRATAVVTNFFHGCVFALRFARPFVAALSPYRSAKIRDLLDLIDSNERVVNEALPASFLAESLRTPPSTLGYRRIDQLRKDSTEYLEHALAGVPTS